MREFVLTFYSKLIYFFIFTSSRYFSYPDWMKKTQTKWGRPYEPQSLKQNSIGVAAVDLTKKRTWHYQVGGKNGKQKIKFNSENKICKRGKPNL